MKVIFLDIDGVLDGHDWDEAAQSNTIRPECVERPNRIIGETGAVIVLSSAWRYMVAGGDMTLRGFEYMLRTHRCAGLRIVGQTCGDEQLPGRGDQILDWLEHHQVERWIVLDDQPEGINLRGVSDRMVRTDGRVGLTDADVGRAIWMLNELA